METKRIIKKYNISEDELNSLRRFCEIIIDFKENKNEQTLHTNHFK